MRQMNGRSPTGFETRHGGALCKSWVRIFNGAGGGMFSEFFKAQVTSLSTGKATLR
ncbi:hypothetical protein Z945_3386 [Sulfitobacter noctilucae]|nr:hypothetical protein Z945_3386 [Sulfitobacter noctilucae]